ncbi:cation:proton antiporter domain-containing protein [Chryseosolibacter indicus]|uniref:Cation:proton antiporter n=1 Tax=Chryseosolibacter indicus TaxID=2782351 RepID=A0ABS5VRL6_9BACT|nr:cation:proton antiporter [Chryseosolibacter indicus]MBT1704083.1 cation:proton antiporter [Chryseosolibacter indicus]
MGHLPDLIRDLALILMAGAIITLIFKKIKQPLVLGYIIAGFLVGPYFKVFPTVADHENIEIWAEIGVIFLLFSLGLEFSFKKLVRVGGAASITAFVEIAFITVSGYFAGRWMGWSTMDSLFLGGMLASSSTTIIIRAFDELGVKTKQYARIVFGVLVVEDIVVILLMVLLSTIAVTKQFEGMEIVYTIVKLLFFLAIWFIAGIFLLPTLLKKARALLDEENLLILSIGLCLAMVVLATKVGFSAELGAFIMGSIIAETTSAEKVEHLTKPVKDLFGSIFFVSVGMLIDPQAIIQYGWPVVVVTLLTLFGKLFSTTIGALISGQPLKQSVQVGMSMAQIGEFAFIVATLGLSLGVISDFLFPIAVGASAITTFTTPYLIKFSESFYFFLERFLPESWIRRLNTYSSGTQSIQAETDWRIVLKSYRNIVVSNGVLLLILIWLTLNFLVPYLEKTIEGDTTKSVVALVISLVLGLPFLWAIMAKRPDNSAYKELWMEKKYNKGPLFILEVGRVLLGLVLIVIWTVQIIPTRGAIFIVLPVVAGVLFLFAKRMNNFYSKLEKRFFTNLNARETETFNTLSARVARKNVVFQTQLTPWDAHIVQLEVPPDAAYIGKPLKDLQWREKYGINVVYIRRAESLIHVPDRKQFLLPFDQVGIVATDEQITAFKPVFDQRVVRDKDAYDIDIGEIVFEQLLVDEHTQLKGVSIRNSGLRERTNGLVIGIERNNERILNPDSTTIFDWGDIIWIVGERSKIQSLKTTK